MNLSAPKSAVWLIALIVGLVAVLMTLGVVIVPALTHHAFWLMTGAWALLIIATLLKHL